MEKQDHLHHPVKMIGMRFFSTLLVLLLFNLAQAQNISEKLSAMNSIFPSEKIYLQTDRTFYAVQDDVFFKVYAVNGESHRPTDKSNLVSVNLVDPRGNVIQTRQLALDAGKASGSFELRQVTGGVYKIRAFTNWTGNLGTEYIFEKELTVRQAVYTSLLLKMETELKSYLPGQRVNAWFKAADVDNHPITGREVNYEVLYQSSLQLKGTAHTNQEGKAIISFDIPKDIRENDLVLTAYVDYEGKRESVFKPVILNLEEVSLDFLPEGGNLVNDLPSVVAFRAIKKNGKPVEVQGKIVDETGKMITEFKSVKFGMGKFNFTPLTGHAYTAEVRVGAGQVQKFSLPQVQPQGITMTCEKNAQGKDLVKIYASEKQTVSLFWYGHGKIYSDKKIELQAGENVFDLPTDSITPGIVQLTLFKGVQPLCERLVFVNKYKTLSVEVTTEKEKYSPFEKVEMKFLVKDHLGKPVEGNFSLAVVDDKNLTMADDKQDNILSSLLMSSELKGKIEELLFYFKKDEPLADALLDLVMLTHGWRRYNWNEIQSLTSEDWKNRIKYEADAPGYRGNVRMNGSPYEYKKVQVTLFKPRKLTVMSDTNGNFLLPVDRLEFPVKMKFSRNGYSEKIKVNEYELTRNNMLVRYNPFAVQKNPLTSAEVSEQKELFKKDVTLVKKEETVIVSAKKSISSVPAVGGTIDLSPSFETAPGVNSDRELSEVVIVQPTLRNSLQSLDLYAVPSRVSTSVSYIEAFNPNYDYLSSGRYYSSYRRFGLQYVGYSTLTNYSKEFYAPAYYDKSNDFRKASDDRKTLYWQHTVVTGKDGKASVAFYTCKNVSSYTVNLEGMGNNGQIGTGTANFYVQKPLSIQAKLPVVITRGDHFVAKCVIANHTDKNLTANVKVSDNMDFKLVRGSYQFECNVPADSFVVKEIELEVLSAPAAVTDANRYTGNRFSISIEANGMADEVSQQVVVNKAGFDYYATTGGNEKEKTFSFEIKDPVNNDFNARIEVLVDPCRDLDKSLQGMIREPYGCFEQVSSSNYPNILALQFLQKKGKADPEFTAKAMTFLRNGYKKLAAYETSEHGFEWYGHTPPHESLTAMGLMQFYEMKKLGVEVDEKLVERSIKWLMGRRTSSGEFMQNPGKYGFSGAPRATASAYITYALSCMGEKDLEKEIAAIAKGTSEKFDFYQMALLANTLFNLGKTEQGKVLVKKLVEHVQKKGIEKIETGPSFTYCYSPVAECLSLLTMAIADHNLTEYSHEVLEYIGYIYSKRTYYGSFGSTQQTVLSLRAIMSANEMLNNSQPTTGEMLVYINDKQLPAYKVGTLTDIHDLSLGKYLVKGENKIKFVCSTESEKGFAYSFGANWKELLPEEKADNKVNIETTYPKTSFKEGETARLNIALSNTTSEGLPQTVAVIGTPAGMSFDSQELKRLMDEKLFDYYELKDNYLVLYYTELAPSAVVNIPLNLKSEICGTFVTPPTCAYLYYNSEYKSWSKTGTITIR